MPKSRFVEERLSGVLTAGRASVEGTRCSLLDTVRGGIVRSDGISEFLSGIAVAIKPTWHHQPAMHPPRETAGTRRRARIRRARGRRHRQRVPGTGHAAEDHPGEAWHFGLFMMRRWWTAAAAS
jgi:hypothetical protein